MESVGSFLHQVQVQMESQTDIPGGAEMEQSELEERSDISTEETEPEGEMCADYYPGQLSDYLDQLNEARGRKLEEQLFLGIP